MKSIRDTMKITNAMYMISSTKLNKAKRELEETEPFFYTLQSMVARIIRHVPDMEHRYFRQGKPEDVKSRGYLVVTADKGMAGAYNHNVLKLAEQELQKSENSSLLVIGEVGRQYFHTKKIPVDEEFLYTAQNPTMSRARVITGKILEMYESNRVQEVYMIFTKPKNAVQTETEMMRLLPLEKEDFSSKAPVDVYHEEFHFQPSPETVMDYIVPNFMAGYIFGAMMESYCSEHNARMTAMQSANDSAQAILHNLSIEYNRVRQAAITQEITEVIGGAKAQKKKKSKGVRV
jgi:F-type H+-transporting ATPase subunit gamma